MSIDALSVFFPIYNEEKNIGAIISKIREHHPCLDIIVVNDFFSENVAQKILDKYGSADLIAANNVYAHISDIHDITSGVEKLLSKDGVFIFEVHYIANLIEEIQYDMIYHEHLYYYSFIALEKFFSQ